MTLGGQLQRAHMRSCFVKWKRVESLGMKPTKLIEYEELMLIGPPHHPKPHMPTKN